MASLSNSARALLRSRVRRHPDGPASKGVDVAGLANADLIQAAMLLDLDIPTAAEVTFMDTFRASG